MHSTGWRAAAVAAVLMQALDDNGQIVSRWLRSLMQMALQRVGSRISGERGVQALVIAQIASDLGSDAAVRFIAVALAGRLWPSFRAERWYAYLLLVLLTWLQPKAPEALYDASASTLVAGSASLSDLMRQARGAE